MQNANDDDNSSGTRNSGESSETKTIEYFLKQAHKIHNNEVRALKKQIKELKTRLEEEILKNSKRCPKCEINERSLEKLKLDYEEQMNEKNRKICELKRQREFNSLTEVKSCNGLPPVVQVESLRKKRRLLGRAKASPSSGDDVQILTMTSDTRLPKGKNVKEQQVEVPDPQLFTANGFTLVPETEMAVPAERRDVNPVVVLETLDIHEDHDPSQAITNHTLKNGRNPCVRVDGNPELEVDSVAKLRGMDFDQSLDDFQTIFSTKEILRKGLSNVGKHIPSKNGSTSKGKGPVRRGSISPPPPPALSSTYKFHFSPARKGHRKPKFKQTTLTQVTFEAALQCRRKVGDLDDYELNKAIEESLRVNGSVPERQATKTEDSCLDSTFVPSQVLRKVQAQNRQDGKWQSDEVKMQELQKVIDVKDSPDSEDLLKEMLMQPTPHASSNQNVENDEEAGGKEKVDVFVDRDDDFLDDFDKVPNAKSSPRYKYKEDPVRKRDERRKLNGHECRECASYFDAMNLDDEDKRRRLKECSRHRSKHAMNTTPEHFWEIDFPSTEENKRRGVTNPTQNVPLRRRRPLMKS